MRKIVYFISFSMVFLIIGLDTLQAQGRLLRRLQDEAEKKAVDEIFNRGRDNQNQPSGDSGQQGEEAYRPGQNRRGGGLSQSVPDVNAAIANARGSFSSKDYKGAKSSVREALWGVELEIGKNVLKSLPESVRSLNYVPANDRVTSSGAGFVGMLIERVYTGGDEMELVVSIGNDAGLLGVARFYMASGMYAQSTDQTNYKQIRFQDHNAYIEYDDYSGYTLSTPFGQSSIFVLRGINFDSESDFMAAANQYNINDIKQKLGEQ